jgi:hypothetical protein
MLRLCQDLGMRTKKLGTSSGINSLTRLYTLGNATIQPTRPTGQNACRLQRVSRITKDHSNGVQVNVTAQLERKKEGNSIKK